MNDGQYNEFIRNQLQNNEEGYFADIEHNKNLVWDNIEKRLQKKKMIPLWIYSAAALMIIMLAFGFIVNRQIQKRNIEISDLKTRLEKQQLKWVEYELGNCNTMIQLDTLKLVQQKIVYQSLTSMDTIILYDTISKLIVQSDTVFIHAIENQIIAQKELPEVEKTSENNEIVVNQQSTKRKNNKRIIFRFGKQNNQIPASNYELNESKGLISLKSK